MAMRAWMGALLVAVVIAVAAVSVGQEKAAGKSPYPSELPEGEGKDIVQQNCLICHSAMLITQQRKTPEGWEKTLGTMIDWGTRIRRSDREAVLNYLKTNFAAAPAPAPAPPKN